MRNHLITSLGFAALLAGPAYAADVAVPRKAPPMVAEDPWSGLYLGVSGGWAKTSASFDTPIINLGTFDQKGWLAGGTAGYNWRIGQQAIFGLELDVSAADIAGSLLGGNCTGPLGCAAKIGWFYTGRARLGVPIGIFMPYVTGGGAVAGIKAIDPTNPSNSGSMPHLWGWTAGGGVEVMFIPQWSFKAEYLHVAFSNKFEGPDLISAITERPVDMVRVGINFYLGSDKQITAR